MKNENVRAILGAVTILLGLGLVGYWLIGAAVDSESDDSSSSPGGGGPGHLKKNGQSHPGSSLPDRSKIRMLSFEKFGSALYRRPLDIESVEAYLESKGRSTDALLAAGLFHPGGAGTELIREAMKKSPDDPAVQLLALVMGLVEGGEREKWLQNFERSQPDNALMNYLRAEDYLERGAIEKGIDQLRLAEAQIGFEDFRDRFSKLGEQLLLATGSDERAARLRSMADVPLPYLHNLQNISKVLEGQVSGGNTASSSDEINLFGLQMGRRLREGDAGNLLIQNLVGLSLETNFVNNLDPEFLIPGRGMTAHELQQELAGEKVRLHAMLDGINSGSFPRARLDEYFDRLQTDGELTAMEWLLGGEQGSAGSGPSR